MGGAEVQIEGNSVHTKHQFTLKEATFNEPLCMSIRSSVAYGRTCVACDRTEYAHAMEYV